MQDLESTFMPAQLKDKMVNIGDDISMNTLLDGAVIKILCGTLPIMVQQKYEKPYELVNEAKFIFSCNKMPMFKDHSDGLYRRLEIIEITNRVPPDKRNSNLIEQFTHEDLQYLLWRSFVAINSALVNDKLIDTVCCQEALEKFRTQSSTLLSFVKGGESINYGKTAIQLDTKQSFIGASIAKKYREYALWCQDYGRSKQSLENFVENVCSEFGLIISKGKFYDDPDKSDSPTLGKP